MIQSFIMDNYSTSPQLTILLANQDLLPKGRYFRFNPYMTEDILLDENRPEKIDQLIEDVQLYLRKNGVKLSTAAKKLKEDRQPWQKLRDYSAVAKH